MAKQIHVHVHTHDATFSPKTHPWTIGTRIRIKTPKGKVIFGTITARSYSRGQPTYFIMGDDDNRYEIETDSYMLSKA